MYNRSTLTFNRYSFTDRRWVWLPVLAFLVVLISNTASGCDCQESIAGSCWHANQCLVGCLEGRGESADVAYLITDTANAAGGGRLFFSSPAETETPDVEPVMSGSSKFSAPATRHAVTMPKASIIIEGISVPLYLAHQSLLC